MGEPGFDVEQTGDDKLVVSLRGEWTFDHASAIDRSLQTLDTPSSSGIEFRCAGLDNIDLTGAWLLYSKSLELESEGHPSEFSGFKDVVMTNASQWYRAEAQREYELIKGKLYGRMVELLGKADADHFVDNWRALAVVCDSGELQQGYCRGTK